MCVLRDNETGDYKGRRRKHLKNTIQQHLAQCKNKISDPFSTYSSFAPPVLPEKKKNVSPFLLSSFIFVLNPPRIIYQSSPPPPCAFLASLLFGEVLPTLFIH